jgi:hypothetical protein
LYFDGNGDSLNGTAGNPNVAFGTGDFTVEFWAWKSADGVSGYDGVCGCDTTGNAIGGWVIELSSIRGFFFYTQNTVVISNNTNPNDSTWHHYALTRSGGTVRYFRDGNLITSATYTGDILSTVQFRIGILGSSAFFNGYLQDLLITNGIARYEQTFTPPTQAFQTY